MLADQSPQTLEVAAQLEVDPQVSGAGGAVHGAVLDRTDPGSCQELVQDIVVRRGREGVLVNNAGVNRRGALLDLSE